MVKAHVLPDISWPTYGNEHCEKYQCEGGGRRGSLVQDAWNIKMQWAGQSCCCEHSGDAVRRSLDWTKCRGQGRIIKRLEHTPSGITEGRMGTINRELYLLGKARRWKHWLRLFCWLGGTLWFMCWWGRSVYYAKAVPPGQLKRDRTRGALAAPLWGWPRGSRAHLWIRESHIPVPREGTVRIPTAMWFTSSWSREVACRGRLRHCGKRAAIREVIWKITG